MGALLHYSNNFLIIIIIIIIVILLLIIIIIVIISFIIPHMLTVIRVEPLTTERTNPSSWPAHAPHRVWLCILLWRGIPLMCLLCELIVTQEAVHVETG